MWQQIAAITLAVLATSVASASKDAEMDHVAPKPLLEPPKQPTPVLNELPEVPKRSKPFRPKIPSPNPGQTAALQDPTMTASDYVNAINNPNHDKDCGCAICTGRLLAKALAPGHEHHHGKQIRTKRSTDAETNDQENKEREQENDEQERSEQKKREREERAEQRLKLIKMIVDEVKRRAMVARFVEMMKARYEQLKAEKAMERYRYNVAQRKPADGLEEHAQQQKQVPLTQQYYHMQQAQSAQQPQGQTQTELFRQLVPLMQPYRQQGQVQSSGAYYQGQQQGAQQPMQTYFEGQGPALSGNYQAQQQDKDEVQLMPPYYHQGQVQTLGGSDSQGQQGHAVVQLGNPYAEGQQQQIQSSKDEEEEDDGDQRDEKEDDQQQQPDNGQQQQLDNGQQQQPDTEQGNRQLIADVQQVDQGDDFQKKRPKLLALIYKRTTYTFNKKKPDSKVETSKDADDQPEEQKESGKRYQRGDADRDGEQKENGVYWIDQQKSAKKSDKEGQEVGEVQGQGGPMLLISQSQADTLARKIKTIQHVEKVRRAMQHVMDAIVPRAWTNHQATSWQI
jgi:hypothetical protein